MNLRILVTCLFLSSAAVAAVAQTNEAAPASSGLSDADLKRAGEAIERGLTWLAAGQRANGSWSNESHPALTALPMWAFVRSQHPKRAAVIAAARKCLMTYVQEDGGIYRKTLITGGLSTYNTALSMTALHELRDPALNPVILNARKFMAGSQQLGSGDAADGGFGYSRDPLFIHADLQNTAAAVQAMRLTADVEDLRPTGEKRVDVDWNAVVKFLGRLQNGPQTGEDNVGGMTYKPGSAKAGTVEAPDGTLALRSSGSMTYSGFLSMIYADLDRKDPRVQSALAWARRHWTLDENPGVGDSGLYFFYNVMSRALSTYGENSLAIAPGRSVEWRVEYVRKVTGLQKADAVANQGYWVNGKSNRFWEGDPVLVTAYAILGLQSAIGQ